MTKNICSRIPLLVILFLVGCTNGFEDKNQDPYAIKKIDPGLLFTGAERGMNGANSPNLVTVGNWDGEQTIVQQYMNAYNSGATAGFQFNLDIDGYNTPRWGV